ncbi:hypothetical protein C1646_818568 [Rhizophagus diaphanus]|nr:hypothetical protein C1646_818568 [Rhizophagus diaphanus] [Rhizophagus sp. MUCL 43196]
MGILTVIITLLYNVNNSSLQPIEQQILEDDIDWEYTKKWINYNPLDAPAHAKLSKFQCSRIKKFIYPTVDIIQWNYPLLYPNNPIPCLECTTHVDNNEHIGICPAHFQCITTVINKYKTIVFQIIENYASGLNFDLRDPVLAFSGIWNLETCIPD